RGIVRVRRLGPDHATRTELLPESISRIGALLRLLLGVEMVEIAELSRRVAVVFQQLGNRGVFFLKPDGRAGYTDLAKSGPKGGLSGDEAGAPGRAALLRIVVREDHPLFGDPIDVGRSIAH